MESGPFAFIVMFLFFCGCCIFLCSACCAMVQENEETATPNNSGNFRAAHIPMPVSNSRNNQNSPSLPPSTHVLPYPPAPHPTSISQSSMPHPVLQLSTYPAPQHLIQNNNTPDSPPPNYDEVMRTYRDNQKLKIKSGTQMQ